MIFAPFDRLSPHASAVIADVVCGALLALWVVALVARAVRGLARGREAAANLATRLRPGVITVHGRAQLEPGADGSPVLLSIHQVGEARRGREGSYVVWREVRRETRARPFYLSLPGGDRLRVEPDAERLQLVDELTVSQRAPGASERSRAVSVDPGQEVYVRGEVQRAVDPHGERQGYRDVGAPSLVMRPGPEGLLISSRPVDHLHRRRAAFDLTFAALGLTILSVCQLLVFDEYRALRTRGTPVQAVVTGLSQYTTHNKSGSQRHFVIMAQLDDGTAVRDEVSRAAWTAASRSVTVPFTIARGGRAAQVGVGEVGIFQQHAVAAVFSVAALFVVYFGLASNRRSWFERRRLVETEPGTL
ncbi:MAG: hypothetical protein R3A48_20710 [Polyangiales bacterium]